MVIYSVENFV